MKKKDGNCICNHRGGKGEIGSVLNHTVYQEGTIGGNLLNHALDDGAPNSGQVIQFQCNDEELALRLGLYSYPIRSLVTSSPGDIFQIGEELKAGLSWLKDHYAGLGIDCANEFIFNYEFFKDRFTNYKLSVFFFGQEANQVRPDERRLSATRSLNNKNFMISMARRLGVNTPQTDMYDSVDRININRYRKARYPLVVKIANSVSGLGFAKCYDHRQLEVIIERIAKMSVITPFQIQEYMEEAVFYSAQWWISEELGVFPITGTCNFIEGDANHAGNWGGREINHDGLFAFTRKLAERAALLGIKDWIGFDVAFWMGQFYLIECNPRYTGAAYPYVAVQKLLGRQQALLKFWAHRNYSVNRESIEEFHLNGFEFDSRQGSGWVVINPGPLTVGDRKIGMLWIGEKEKYLQAEDKLKTFLA